MTSPASPTESIAPQAIHEPFLDGLRGMAILMVMLLHASSDLKIKPHFVQFTAFLEHMSYGVQLFFVLSAFTLFRSMHSRRLNGEQSWIAFYIRRAFRILPLWWITCLLFWPLVKNEPRRDLIESMTFYYGFRKDLWFVCVTVTAWSLFVEETFYFFFPLWFKLVRGFKTALIGVGLSYAVAWIWERTAWRIPVEPDNPFVGIHPLANYYTFFVGIALFYAYEKWGHRLHRLGRRERLMLAALSWAGAVLVLTCDRRVAVIGMIPIFASAASSRTLFGKLMRWDPLRQYGVCCYSIYLLHPLVLRHLWPLYLTLRVLGLSHAPQEVYTAIWYVVLLVIILPVGVISFHLIEQPCVRLGRKLIASGGNLASQILA